MKTPTKDEINIIDKKLLDKYYPKVVLDNGVISDIIIWWEEIRKQEIEENDFDLWH